MTGMGLFGAAVGICVGTVALSAVLKAFGKGNIDVYLGAVAEIAMLGLMLGGVYMALNMIMVMFGINIPVGWDAIDKLWFSGW